MNPKLVRETSPYLRKPVSVERMMGDVLIALIPVLVFSIITFGLQALWVTLISLLVMIGTEIIFYLIVNKKDFKSKFSINMILAPAISAIIFAMLIPQVANVDFPKMIYIVVIGSFAGIFLGKMVFGGLGGNIFNPAATGRIFITIAFSSAFVYSNQSSFDTTAGATALSMLKDVGGIGNIGSALESYSLMDLFLGNVPGTMGEGSVVAILMGAAYLFYRKSADFRVTLSVIISFAVLMLTAGITYNAINGGINIFEFLLFQLFGGGLIFGAVFMATDPVTSPVTKTGRILYGALMGAIVVFIRLFGAYPEGMAFAILIMNMFVPLIDIGTKTKYSKQGIIKFLLLFVLLIGIIIETQTNNFVALGSSICIITIGILYLVVISKKRKAEVL